MASAPRQPRPSGRHGYPATSAVPAAAAAVAVAPLGAARPRRPGSVDHAGVCMFADGLTATAGRPRWSMMVAAALHDGTDGPTGARSSWRRLASIYSRRFSANSK